MASKFTDIKSYQIYAFHESNKDPKSKWNPVGQVDALPLPMACTLTQFQPGHTYHFAVRSVDSYGRIAEFSQPRNITLQK